MTTPSFGIFDHIEGIPGTPTNQLLKDRLALVRTADEAGFSGYYFAEHHGSDLCMTPSQELFIAAASQVTSQIRLGPMVKLLPMHPPVQLIEDLCVLDNLLEGRLDYGVGRGAVPVEHYWFGDSWPQSRERFVDVLRIIQRALATGEISSEGSAFYDFPTMPMSTRPFQKHIPFWYPGNPVAAGQYGLSLMWPGPIEQGAYDTYVEAWHRHKDDELRLDAPDAEPRVAYNVVLAIAPTEDEAQEIARRGMEGLVRRTRNAHRFDRLVISEEECEAAQGPLRAILATMEPAITFGAGTTGQIAERLAAVLESGLSDYICFMLPTGDMSLYEARRTLDLFVTEVKPQLEQVTASR